MEQFLKTLLALSLAGTALALILMLLDRFRGKRISSSFVYFAWLLVLLRFVLPVPGLLSVPAAAPSAHAAPATRPAWDTAQAPVRSYRDGENPGPDGMTAVQPQPVHDFAEPAVRTAEEEEETPYTPQVKRAVFPSWTLLFWIWAAGTFCTAGWNLSGYFRYRRALYRTLRPAQEQEATLLGALHPRPWPVLYRSGAVTTPLLLGPPRPVIVLPDRAYTPEMLGGILRHELTHYRRGDLAVKWFATAVLCVHWYNPFVYLFRREIDRACELSCDERLLRDMDVHEKQCYGELLLTLAADRPLPRRVVAMSFATEKRNLKERLIQIMTFKKKGRAAFVVMLAAMAMLVGCAVAMGPAAPATQEAAPSDQVQNDGGAQDPTSDAAPESLRAGGANGAEGNGQEIYVDTVDGFLSALGSDRTVILAAGEYNLTQAADYGSPGTEYYSWEEVFDGYELVLNDLDRLMIVGEGGAEAVSIVTEPRYANVLRFEDCRAVSLNTFTAGHTLEQGTCVGGVLYFDSCTNAFVDGCVLYGCGTVGITAFNSNRVFAQNTTIRECSYGAVKSQGSFDVRFTDGKIYDCGLKGEHGCFNLLDVITTTGFAVHNTEIYGNDAMLLLSSEYSTGVELRGCRVYGNQFNEGIHINGQSVVIDGCTLGDNAVVTGSWYADPERAAVDRNGYALSAEALTAMEWVEYAGSYTGPEAVETPEPPYETGEDGQKIFHVTTVDEFLAAIGSSRTIYLDAELFDLSAAGNYGGYGGTYYYWQNNFDGVGLVITGVEHLNIIGMGKDKTNVETLPRYADVLSFLDCSVVTVQALTAGHTLGAGSCVGDVISFRNCDDCVIRDCGLFGCGVNGINAYQCRDLAVLDTEIYECSGYGAVIQECFNTVFEGCSIHDCEYNTLWVTGEADVTWDGELLQ